MRTNAPLLINSKSPKSVLFISNLTSVVLENEREATFERFNNRSDLPEITKSDFYAKYNAIGSLSAQDLIAEMQSGELLGHALHPLHSKRLKWECNCSLDRIEGMLKSLGQSELEHNIKEDGKAEVVCDYCNTPYRLSLADLNRLLDELLQIC